MTGPGAASPPAAPAAASRYHATNVSPGCGTAPARNCTVDPVSVKSIPGFCTTPFRNIARLVAGLGVLASVKVPFDPSTVPAGTSPSTNCGPLPLHGPDVPSTSTQSEGLPTTASIAPVALIAAA